ACRFPLVPVHATSADANGWHGAPIKALDEAKTGRLCEESNEEWRSRAPVPSALRPKWPCTSLQSLARHPACLRLRASRMAISAPQRVSGHSVNRHQAMLSRAGAKASRSFSKRLLDDRREQL